MKWKGGNGKRERKTDRMEERGKWEIRNGKEGVGKSEREGVKGKGEMEMEKGKWKGVRGKSVRE